ncbi:DUF6538 domain-containing protein [Mesorhizobium sp.]|uniref:DUF6538 domain-containing protein n=1 Tax=Mesorhizobium sp. TaxID=1871066 RepID=UPI0025CD5C48|nr:DUF6538 domain-containing protein [Mesorhizobium sp.]
MRKEAVAEPARDPDRYLVQRDGVFYYHRRMPAKMVGIDDRGRFIRKSLETDERRLARAMRDKLEDADKTLWAILLSGGETRSALDQYRDAVRRAEAMGVSYLSNGQVAGFQNVDSILKRVEALERVQAAPAVADALLGGVRVPPVKISEAFDVYADEIMAHEVVGKSQSQRRMWKKVKQRAINNFVALVGDKPIGEITREDGLTFYRFWLRRVAPPPEVGPATHSRRPAIEISAICGISTGAISLIWARNKKAPHSMTSAFRSAASAVGNGHHSKPNGYPIKS